VTSAARLATVASTPPTTSTSTDPNVIWSTSSEDDTTWGSSGDDQVVYPESSSDPLPVNPFGVEVPLVLPSLEPVVGSVLSVIPVSLGGF